MDQSSSITTVGRTICGAAHGNRRQTREKRVKRSAQLSLPRTCRQAPLLKRDPASNQNQKTFYLFTEVVEQTF